MTDDAIVGAIEPDHLTISPPSWRLARRHGRAKTTIGVILINARLDKIGCYLVA